LQPKLNSVGYGTIEQRLRVGIAHVKFNSLYSLAKHVIYSIAAASAYADYLDNGTCHADYIRFKM
jgi:hypothetical protein